MGTSQLRGCEDCEHFVEVELHGTPHNWRRYCGLGNFNIDLASFEVVKTSHNKNRYQRKISDMTAWSITSPSLVRYLEEQTMENLEINFIKSKDLLDEFNEYKKQREEAATGYEIFFEVMLGDGDGDYTDHVHFTKKILEDFLKYFEAPEWGKHTEHMALIEIDHEFIPGSTVYVDQMEKLFKWLSIGNMRDTIGTDCKHSIARFSYEAKKADVNDWEKSEYYVEDADLEESRETYDLAEDLDEFFSDIYFRYVKPYVEECKFKRADWYGPYKLSA